MMQEMIQLLTALSAQWFETMLLMTIQSSLFLCALFMVLHFLRGKNASRLRWLALLGLCKFLLPPLDVLPSAAQVLPSRLDDILIFSDRTFDSVPVSVPSESAMTIQTFLFISWATIAIGFLVVSTLRTIDLYRRFKGAPAMDVSRYGFSKSLRVVMSAENHSPFVVGVFKPMIVLPASFEAWSERAKRAVLWHEVAHLRQYDHVLNVFQTVAKAIHFFNPLVWLLSKKLDELREMSCDDVAVASAKISSADYAAELLAVAERNSVGRVEMSHGTGAFSERYNSLKTRLAYQISNKEDLKMKRVIFCACAALMLMLSLNCGNQTKTEDAASVNPSAAGSSSEPTETPDFVEVDEAPIFINQARAEYPKIASAHGIEAKVVAKVLIDQNGQAERVEILKYVAVDTSNSPERQAFEAATKKAIQASTFKPAMKNGKPVKVWMVVPTKFKLSADGIPKLISVEKSEGSMWYAEFSVPRQMQVTLTLAHFSPPQSVHETLCNEVYYPHFKDDGKTHLHPMRVEFNAEKFPKGTYLVKMTAEDYSEAKKITIN